ncbi:MAG TPA: GNAT family N-acetyltransferase [Chitinophagaceae bacterium]|jgi:ElaA protein|nr:GNAT family N-acetyltransferase [Chitinophagaceae bacterium]
MKIKWISKKFHDLTVDELYTLLRLRSEVFVVEQNCVFLDMDDKDQKCVHLLGWIGDDLAASARIVPAGISYTEPSIGRVVTSPKYRGTGSGKELMEEAIRLTIQLHGNQPIRIGAQLYLKKFYTSLGFIADGEIYLEDGIEHIEMVRVR